MSSQTRTGACGQLALSVPSPNAAVDIEESAPGAAQAAAGAKASAGAGAKASTGECCGDKESCGGGSSGGGGTCGAAAAAAAAAGKDHVRVVKRVVVKVHTDSPS